MDYYTGQIILWPCPKIPQGWHICDGTLLPIAGNEALYSIIGVIYGGNGSTNFALPSLSSRVPIGQGLGTGLTNRVVGQTGGEESVTLTSSNMPPHTHAMYTTKQDATSSNPANLYLATLPKGTKFYFNPVVGAPDPVAENSAAISVSGGGGAHNNIMPSIGIRYIICLSGIYPVKP